MTKFTRFKMLLMALVMLVGSGNVSSQLLVENFDYTIGTVLTTTATADPTTGWLAHSGNGTANIDVTSGLTFTGYAGSGVGGAANLDATGQDINKTFTSQTSGTLYAAFMIQTQATNAAGYFAMFGPTPMASAFYSRVWVNATGTGVGVSGSSAPASYTTITAGTPVLLVLKHDFTSHVSSLYVLGAFSATEPASANTTFTETVAAIGTFGLRQYNASQRVMVDGIRIATTWAEAVAPAGAPTAVSSPTFSPVAGSYYSTQNVSLSSTTEGATIYYTTDGSDPDNTDTQYTTPIAVSITTTIKAIAYKTDMEPSSIATAEYNIVLTPTITVTEETVPSMTTQVGSTDAETITVNGMNLTSNITLEVSGTNASLFTLSTSSLTHTEGTVADQSVTITYTPTAPGSHTATLTLSSNGAVDVVKSLSGSAIWPPLDAPEAKTASGSNTSGFTANWTEVNGATEYQLNVYTKVGETEFFDLAPTPPADWSFTSISSYTSSSTGYFGLSAPSVKYDGTGDVVITPDYSNSPNKVSFWMRGASTDVNSALLFEGYNGSEWATIENIKPLPTTATTKVYDQSSSPVLSSGLIKFRFTYTKSVGNLAFDDFAAVNVSQIAGSPFTIVNDTVKAITGLNSGTTYYYTVVAKNTNVTSVTSNEIAASTLSTSISVPVSINNITAFDGKIRFSATAGQQVEVYNAVGQKLMSATTLDGLNTLNVNAKGMMIVKVGDRLAKVIL